MHIKCKIRLPRNLDTWFFSRKGLNPSPSYEKMTRKYSLTKIWWHLNNPCTLVEMPSYSGQTVIRAFNIFNITNLVTISCDIGLAPKQSVNQYKLSSLYDQCDVPSRSSSRKRRSEPEVEDLSKITIAKTINISKKSNEKSNSFLFHSFSVALIVIAMFLLWLLLVNLKLQLQIKLEQILFSNMTDSWEQKIIFPSMNIERLNCPSI